MPSATEDILFHTQSKDRTITSSHCKETVNDIMILYKNMKVMVHSPDSDTNVFDIVTGILQIGIILIYDLPS